MGLLSKSTYYILTCIIFLLFLVIITKKNAFMKALIIGSEGNIGKPLVKHLKSLQYEVMG